MIKLRLYRHYFGNFPMQGEKYYFRVEGSTQGENVPHKVEMATQGENASGKLKMPHAR